MKGIEFAGEDSYTVTTQEYTDDNSYTACVEDYYYKTDGDTLLPLDSDRVEDYLRGIAGLSLTNYVTYNVGLWAGQSRAHHHRTVYRRHRRCRGGDLHPEHQP